MSDVDSIHNLCDKIFYSSNCGKCPLKNIVCERYSFVQIADLPRLSVYRRAFIEYGEKLFGVRVPERIYDREREGQMISPSNDNEFSQILREIK